MKKTYALMLALALSATAAAENRTAAAPDAAAAPMLSAAQNHDPYEPYNRFMFKINDAADRYVLAPVARGYRKITPSPVRQGVTNFFDNLRDVVSFGSNVLRLDAKRASEDFMRVAVNSTFGLGGLINIANYGGIPDNKNTLGDTFATWGWKNSGYFVAPLFGPSTVRDTTASAVAMAVPVQNAIFKTDAGRWSITAANAVDTRHKLLDLTDSLDGAALDKYAYTRDMYLRLRAQQLGLTPPPSAAEEEIDIDSLVAPESSGAAMPSENQSAAEQNPLENENAVPQNEAVPEPHSALETDTETLADAAENTVMPSENEAEADAAAAEHTGHEEAVTLLHSESETAAANTGGEPSF